MSKVGFDEDNENEGHAVGKFDDNEIKYKNEISEHDNDTEKKRDVFLIKVQGDTKAF